MPGPSPSDLDLEAAMDDLALPTISVTAEVSNARTATVTLRDKRGNPLGGLGVVYAWLSATAGTAETTAPAGGWAAASGGTVLLKALTTNVSAFWLSEADGEVKITVTDASGAKAAFINVVCPNTGRVVSADISLAA